MAGIDATDIVLIIAAMAFVLTVALAIVTLSVLKKSSSDRSNRSGGETAGGGRSKRRLKNFSTRMSVADLVNENSSAGARLDPRRSCTTSVNLGPTTQSAMKAQRWPWKLLSETNACTTATAMAQVNDVKAPDRIVVGQGSATCPKVLDTAEASGSSADVECANGCHAE